MEKKYLTRKPPTRRKIGTGATKKRVVGKVTTKKKKPWKFKKTELAECDFAFSKEIIARDGYCLYPGCLSENNLTCSHYIGRGNWNTRFDPENCITLCIRHHFMDRNTGYEFQKARIEKEGWDGQYTLFMKKWLRLAAWFDLLERAEGNKSRKDSILETQKKYNLRQPEALLEE